ncbi:MAG: SusD/RagB family nutrient-binding outer membrane lipoprotein [Bacteroidales bacterium]|nr:SusD/RagB family nutrient-binding outer membrane lipoprotein [Bacteroidales bacterium]
MKYKILVLFTVIGLLTSCTGDWLDVNKNPNQPDVPYINLLLPGIQYDIADYLSVGYMNLGYVTGVYTHQISTREGIDQYGIAGDDIEGYWELFYSRPLTDLDLLIEVGIENDYMQYVGIAKILKAYAYSQMVDIWGDIPYTEVNDPVIISPVFDNDEVIYAELFTMIDEGIADLQNTTSVNEFVPGADDMIYGGDIDLWLKAANTLKLKLYNQVRETSMFNAVAVNTLLAGDLIESGEDFMMYFGITNNPENRNPGFVDEYSGSQISTYISPWFFEILNGENMDIYNGITDPRIPYYFCNQHRSSTENPPEYMNGDFVSIYFGSTGTNRDHAGRSTFTMVGFYPVGGRYDSYNDYIYFNNADSAKAITDSLNVEPLGADDALGNAPMRFITYADRLFIEAELALEEGITVNGNAEVLFQNAVRASFDLIDIIIDGTGESAPNFSDLSSDEDYITLIMSEFTTASAAEQFEMIMTQKWIQSWGANVDAYTDYRRTGYPVMFDANSNDGEQSGGPDGSGIATTQCTRGYPLSFPYPNSELDLNTNAPEQKIITTDNVFWDIN